MHRRGRSTAPLGARTLLLLLIATAWALPAHVAHARPPKISSPHSEVVPPPEDQPEPSGPDGSSWRATLSGTLVRRAMATTTWFLYPGACADRALGTWSPKTSPVADSLDSYAEFSTDTFGRVDLSLHEKLWHVADVSTPATQRPAILSGSRSLWCGKYDPSWVLPVGYPNTTYQILYLDSGSHTSSYTLTLQMVSSAQLNYDFLYLIGGGASGATDPLGNSRNDMDAIIAYGVGGPNADSDLLVSWTGSITPSTPGALSINATAGPVQIEGSGSGSPSTVFTSITVPSDHRALYLVFVSQDDFSSQDGLWPEGKGQVLDVIATSDNGSIYNDQTPAGGTDAYGGSVIVGTAGAPVVSSRVPPGVGELWQVRTGLSLPVADACAPQKDLLTDHFFFGGDPGTGLLLPGTDNALVTCTFPVPPGTASLVAVWNMYMDLHKGSGFVQTAEYRFFKNGTWSDWRNTSLSNEAHAGAIKGWVSEGGELAEATQADSVQLRYDLHCLPAFASDKVNCDPNVSRGLLYDDLRLQATSGVPSPIFGLFVGSALQSTFVDGTMTGSNCPLAPCWPGIRGTALGAGVGIDDNVNSALGDSMTVSLQTGLRSRGMGINWKQGFDKSVSAGHTIAHTNGAYNPAFDQPRVIFRLWDPATKSWSPFDSTALDADAVSITGMDTTVIHSDYRLDWPPRDKVAAAANLPGGFTINGVSAYSALSFLPRGTRLQYYLKAVDINGGVAYQFSSDGPAYEVQELPTLPGGVVRAPDIIEFQVLPGVYPAGSPGSLLAGRTSTPILNLDGAYTSWSYKQDPVTQALLGLGVRADRYRFLQAYDSGSNVGGHELPGAAPASFGNFFPNLYEYAILDSLAAWYRIVIQSSHLRTFPVFEDQDARLVKLWWNASTGTNGGDRCIFGSGDDFFDLLLGATPPAGVDQVQLAQDVFGVSSVTTSWAGVGTELTMDDRFAAPGAGPALAAPGAFTYPVDRGCPEYDRLDVLTKIGSAEAANTAFYPGGTDVAGVARMSEKDMVADKDRNKALGYGFSIQLVRQTGYPTTAPNYVHSGVQNRMQLLYKFLASCRGPRTSAPGDTGKCWPCPTDGSMSGNWAALPGFTTGTWGPLYPIQDPAAATGVAEPAPGATPMANALLQNRPNPFNPETVIPYTLAKPGRVVIRVFDISGRLVRTLVDRRETEGTHSVRWDGSGDGGGRMASGVYFYKIQYPDGSVSAKKLTILR
jgi:hypothetical protein